ncbi:FMN-dependent NADH-azoreductase [Catenovulum sediminis]|uniref:FMN dependent NADH:quinone oxidoreductase n=1 Tax=Catenovulum sediminis TaxID=1740262 RepID=A0ABV1RI38_9ALTE|nr:NAD(P)H-dependent oxidoreductase [Catenovulum sediminis]
MNKQVLRIDSSIFGEHGQSSQLIDHLIDRLAGKYAKLDVVTRRFSQDPVPHLDAAWIQALSTEDSQRTAEQAKKVAYSDKLIGEVKNADILVIALPMYNFNVPSMLKAWFDHIARAGVTFKYTEQGPIGLLDDKPVYLVTTRGGIHKNQPQDTEVSFVKTFLNFIGLKNISVVYAEALAMSGHKEQAFETAKSEIESLIEESE